MKVRQARQVLKHLRCFPYSALKSPIQRQPQTHTYYKYDNVFCTPNENTETPVAAATVLREIDAILR